MSLSIACPSGSCPLSLLPFASLVLHFSGVIEFAQHLGLILQAGWLMPE